MVVLLTLLSGDQIFLMHGTDGGSKAAGVKQRVAGTRAKIHGSTTRTLH